jgi:hypothetical protein
MLRLEIATQTLSHLTTGELTAEFSFGSCWSSHFDFRLARLGRFPRFRLCRFSKLVRGNAARDMALFDKQHTTESLVVHFGFCGWNPDYQSRTGSKS